MKLCKNCAHCLWQPLPPHAVCSKEVAHINVVTGYKSYNPCEAERGSSLKERCGPEAIHFVPKAPEPFKTRSVRDDKIPDRNFIAWLKSLFS